MHRRRIAAFANAIAALAALPAAAAWGADDSASVGPVLWQPSLNVFRRFAVEREPMFEFYGAVLGFEQRDTLNVGGGNGVARFRAGASEVKLTARVADRQYVPGGVRDATGVRLRSFGFGLAADTGSGGIQYVVSNVDLVAALASERNVTVDQPLSTLGGFQLRTIWLEDPDGITNYFAETAQARAARRHE